MADRRIIDGDTFTDDRGRRVRLAGVDAPEDTPSSGYEPGGFESTQLARDQLGGGFDRGETQAFSYGREVADVTGPDGRDFGHTLLRNNLGHTTGWSGPDQRQAEMQGTLGDLFQEREPGMPSREHELRESAARERMDGFRRLAAGRHDDRLLAGTFDDFSSASKTDGRTRRGWERGKANLRGQWHGLNNALGQVLGSERMEQSGSDGMQAAMRDALRNPADIGRLDDVESLSDFFVWAGEAFMEEAPGLAMDIGAAAAGALTGGTTAIAAGTAKAFLRNLGGAAAAGQATNVMRTGAQLGLRTGAAASMYVQQTGGAQMDMVGHGIEDRGDRALWLGGVNSAVNYVAFMNILGDISRRFNAGEAADALGGSFLSALRTVGGESLRAGAYGAGQEGMAGLAETLVLELNKAHLDPSYEVNPQNLLEGLVTGGVVGTGVGTTGGAAAGTYQAFGGADEAATDPEQREEGQEAEAAQIDRVRRRAWDERGETTPEPPSSLAATLGDRPTGFVHVSAANARDGVTLNYLRSEYPDLHERELPDGSVQLARTEEGLASAPTDPSEADQAAALGYRQPKDEVMERAARGEPVVALQERDADGEVVRDQVLTEDEVAAAQEAAHEQGHTTEVLTPERLQQERQRDYQADVARLTGTEVMSQEDRAVQVEQEERQFSEEAFHFADEREPAEVAPLIDEAAQLGLDLGRYQRTEPVVDEQVIRRELASRLHQTMPDHPRQTLGDALEGRHLSELDAAELRQLARAMQMRDLPQKLASVEGNRTRYQNIAKSAVARKFNEWKRGSRQDTDDTTVATPVPSDMSLLGEIVPELRGLSRKNFEKGQEGAAAYQTAVRQALQGVNIRERMAGMDDQQLWQTVQMARVEDDVQQHRDGFELRMAEEPRVDAGALSAAVRGRRQEGEAGSRDTRTEVDAAREEEQLLARQDIVESDDPFEDGTNFEEDLSREAKLREGPRAAGIGAAFSALTGQREGGQLDAVMRTQQGALTEEEFSEVDPRGIDGQGLMRALAGRTRDKDAAMREWEQLALTSPQQFAEEFSAALEQARIDPANYVAGQDTSTPMHDRQPTAQGTQSRGLAASTEPGDIGGMDYSSLDGRPEQEASDGLFFIGGMDGARFGYDAEGNVVPAEPIQQAHLSSDSPMHRQRIQSAHRQERLAETGQSSLAPLRVRNREGVEESWLFDLVALSSYGQPGEGQPSTASEAYQNLMLNLSRLGDGPQTSSHLPGGENASYVQSVRSDALAGLDRNKVLWEDGDGNAVTLGQAEHAFYTEVGRANEAADLANRADELRTLQRNRREAMRTLLMRAVNSLEGLEPARRLSRIKALNDAMYQAMDGDQLIESSVLTEHLRPAEVAYIREEAQRAAQHLQEEVGHQEQNLEQREAALAEARRERASVEQRVYANDEMRALAQANAVYAEEARNDAVRLLERTRQRLRAHEELSQIQSLVEGGEEAADMRGVSADNLSAFALTAEEERQIGDTGGHINLEALRNVYRATRDELRSITNTLQNRPRTTPDTDPQTDSLARGYMDDGLSYDEAYEMAAEMRERTDGLTGREAETGGLAEERTGPLTDADGNPMDATLTRDGEAVAAPIHNDRQDSDSETGTSRYDEQMAAEWENTRRKIAERNQDLAEKVEAFKAAHPNNPNVNMAETAASPSPYESRPGAFQRLVQRQRPLFAPLRLSAAEASPAHGAARAQQQAARQAQASGLGTPETPRHAILDAVFKGKPMRVVGAGDADQGAIQSFIGQALRDFRSTDRPALVTVGQSAAQISQFINQTNLLNPNQRKAAMRKLAEARAGERPLYMPMGDFVLIAMPDAPSKGRKQNLRWYHALGHELGHLVFDDYAAAANLDRATRNQLHAAFRAEHGIDPTHDPSLYKEWFANQASNEMLHRAFGQADPEQVTPFTRLANLMQGLWERLQHLIPAMTRTRSFADFAEKIREDQIAIKRGETRADIQSQYAERRRLAQERAMEARDRAAAARQSAIDGRLPVEEARRIIEASDQIIIEANRDIAAGAEVGRRARLGERTADFDIEFHDGGNAMDGARLKRSTNKIREGVSKVNAKSGGVEVASRLFRTVVGRLEGYNAELAGRLFQRSATDRAVKGGPAAWQQMTNAMRDRYTGQMQQTFKRIEAGVKGKKAKEAAIEQAFRDLEAGRRTEHSQLLATVIDGVITNAEQNGLRSVRHPDDFVPVAMNHSAVDGNRQAFAELLQEAFPEDTQAEINQRIEVLLDTNGFSEYATAPGLPVSTHDTTRGLLDHVGAGRLREAGFLNERSDAVLYHWIEGVAKRTAWEANFGAHTRDVVDPAGENERLLGRPDPRGDLVRDAGLVDEHGKYWDPSGRYKQLVAEAVAEHGPAAEKDIADMLDGVMGRKTSQMPRGLRNVNDWVTAWTSWTVLLFSGIASIPEVGLPAVRAHGRVGLLEGLRGFPDAWRLAKDMGVVMSDAGERIIWQSMGDSYESSTLNKMGNTFFKWNGQKLMTDVNRAMGVSFAQRYLLRSAEIGDSQALEQLGVSASEIRQWDAAGRPTWTAGLNTANNVVAEKVQAAINQFVYEGSSMPSKFQNPGWFNNPYMKIFWMIKRYMYAYGEGILMGMWRQGKRQWQRGAGLGGEQRAFLAAAPAMMFAVATIPLAFAGTELREWMRPYTTGRPGKEVEDYGGAMKYGQFLFGRAGGFGPLEAILSARQQSEWGYSPLGSVSPVIAKGEMWMDWGADGQMSQGEFLTRMRQSLPIFSQTPRAWNAMLDAVTD